MVKIQQFPHLH